MEPSPLNCIDECGHKKGLSESEARAPLWSRKAKFGTGLALESQRSHKKSATR
jgi:hypothetical protein